MISDELTQYLEFLYEKVEGYVYVASKPAGASTGWAQEFFAWPLEQQKIHDYITTTSKESNVYIGPAIYKSKSSLKSNVKGSNVAWVEFDGQEQIDFESADIPEPNIIVQTSVATHLHCYWKLIKFSDTETVEDINRRLTYHLEADSSGWDANQVLRPPDSQNWKMADNALPVTMKRFKPELSFEFEAFDKAPEIKKASLLLERRNYSIRRNFLTSYHYMRNLSVALSQRQFLARQLQERGLDPNF